MKRHDREKREQEFALLDEKRNKGNQAHHDRKRPDYHTHLFTVGKINLSQKRTIIASTIMHAKNIIIGKNAVVVSLNARQKGTRKNYIPTV